MNNRKEALAQSGALNKIINLALSFDPPSTVSAAVLISIPNVINVRPSMHAQTSSGGTTKSKPTSQLTSFHSVPSARLHKYPEPPPPSATATNVPLLNPTNLKFSSSTPSSAWH